MSFLFWLISVPILLQNSQPLPTDQLAISMGGLVPIPRPDLSNLEPQVREQLTAVAQTLEQMKPEVTGPIEEIATLFGEAGRHYHAYEMMDSARACYANAVLLDPTRFEWVYLLASLYRDEGLNDWAIHYFGQAYRISDQYVPIYIQFGELYLEQGELDKSKAGFSMALEKNPESAAACFGIGRVALEQEAFEEALGFLSRAIQLAPDADRIHYVLGSTYRQMGDQEKAELHLNKAGKVGVREQDPLVDSLQDLVISESGHLAQGKRAFNAGRYEEAAQEFAKLLENQPDHPEARVNLATALAQAGKIDEAMAEFKRALELNPESPVLHFNLGALYANGGQLSAARNHLQFVVDHDEADLAAAIMLSDVLEAMGDEPQALEILERCAAHHPHDLSLKFRLIRALLKRHDYREAQARFATVPRNLMVTHPGLDPSLRALSSLQSTTRLSRWRNRFGTHA